MDMDMEEKGEAPSRLDQRVSVAVWEIVKSELSLAEGSPLLKALRLVEIDQQTVPLVEIDEKELQKVSPDFMSNLLELFIRRGYKTADIDEFIPTIINTVGGIVNEEKQIHLSPEELEQLEESFRSTYSGDADERFRRYLMRCCSRYYKDSSQYVAPLVLIMQSSGFGKSRLLCEVGQKFAGQDGQYTAKMNKERIVFDPAVLYVCANNVKGSSGFPISTPWLYSFLFERADIAEQLEVVIEHTCANWQNRKEWLELFGKDPTTSAEAHELGTAWTTDTASRKRPQSSPSFDQTFTEALTSHPRKNPRRCWDSHGEQVQVLVLAIDEAKYLIEKKNADGTTYYELLRIALAKVNATMSARKLLVFAVLVDTKSKLRNFLPPLSKAYLGTTGSKRPFPPFVLTYTMDTIAKQRSSPVNYKASVLTEDSHSDQAWRSLASMGRPLWHTHAARNSVQDTLRMAGRKLLRGLNASDENSYQDEKSMQGVTSVLCRLGLRPQANSAFASQVVANFMAVLHYVNFTYDSHICGYVSEPVLAFAATHMWHEQAEGKILEKYILPEFQALLMQGVLDVGGIGEVAARIFLLLAMDEANKMDKVAYGLSGDDNANVFRGQFCSVKKFMGLLDGSRTQSKGKVDRNSTPCPALINVTGPDEDMKQIPHASLDQKKSFTAWMSRWEKWRVGFSHFIELTAMPTEKTLWFLLGRRAAGVFPRNQKGADLIIPIFNADPSEKGRRVSFILVQIKNKSDADKEFPFSAIRKFTPAHLFKAGTAARASHELSQFTPREIIRIFLSLRESNHSSPAQSYLIDRDDRTTTTSYALCLRGTCRPLVRGSKPALTYWPFLLTQKLSDVLAEIADSAYWDALQRIKANLNQRVPKDVCEAEMPKSEVLKSVSFTLGLVPYGTQGAVKDASG